MQKTLLFFFFVLWGFSLFAQKNGTVFIQASPFRNTKGVMRFALYDKKGSFMDSKIFYLNGEAPIKGSKSVASVSVPPGKYAVSLVHDENNNGGMDMSFGLPAEGFGISNISSFPLSKPPFEKCLITVEAGKNTIVLIDMHYSVF
jgi:uncharacterized protein (DUF2141 family)